MDLLLVPQEDSFSDNSMPQNFAIIDKVENRN